jgi:thioredoxin reductase (NADPH)
MGRVYDLAIIGGGPSGLSAAINGASEGLDVLLVDAEATLGGQARESAAIENYPGFPDGVTGDALMNSLTRQAEKFNTGLMLPSRVQRLEHIADDTPTAFKLTDDFGQSFTSRTVLLSLGLAYRRLEADNVGSFLGNGAYYGVPAGRTPTHSCDVVVIGGANSSGQAVLHLARNTNAKVRLLSRSPLSKGMSQYLIDRIHAMPNIEVLEDCVVLGCLGSVRTGKLHEVTVRWEGRDQHIPADYLFMFIGAVPKTYWLDGAVTLAKGFIPTWTDCGAELPFETSMAGVFAAGDVRQGSIKRIAAAVGEGAAALQMIHRRLGS